MQNHSASSFLQAWMCVDCDSYKYKTKENAMVDVNKTPTFCQGLFLFSFVFAIILTKPASTSQTAEIRNSLKI